MRGHAVWDLEANRKLHLASNKTNNLHKNFRQQFQHFLKKIQHCSKHFYKSFAHPQFWFRCSQSRYIAYVGTHMLCWECIRGVYLWSGGQATPPQPLSAQLHKFGSYHLMHFTIKRREQSVHTHDRCHPAVFFFSYSG